MSLASTKAKHRRVRWRVPARKKETKKGRPSVLAHTHRALVRALEGRHGDLWHRINRVVIVAGYPLDRALTRVRRLRSDGAESLLAMAVALLYLTDIRSGFVGKPRAGGAGPWHRYTLADLSQMAFGVQGPADLRRAQRAIDMMISLGWAHPTRQARSYRSETQTFVSFPGIRRLNLDRICDMASTTWHLRRDRQHADAHKGQRSIVSLREGRRPATGAQADRQQAARAHAARHRLGQPGMTRLGHPPPSSGPPEPRLTEAMIFAIINGTDC